MSKKRKKKSDSGKQRPESKSTGAPTPVRGENAEAHEEKRERQKREWAAQKKQRERKPLPIALYAWIATAVAGIAAVVVVAFLVLSGGGSDGSPEPTATPDPRVSGQPIAETIEIEAAGAESGSWFSPATVTANAGEVTEFVVTNTGTVSHNMRVSGPDGKYGDDAFPGDDFILDPFAIKPGETGRVLVKIDEPGSYPFQCDIHPDSQKGMLILN